MSIVFIVLGAFFFLYLLGSMGAAANNIDHRCTVDDIQTTQRKIH